MSAYGLTQRELLSILFKEKRLLISVFVILFALVVGVSFILTPYYQAEARLLVKNGREFQTRSDPGQGQASVPYITKQEIVNSELEILTSIDLIQAVVNKIGLEKLYPDIVSNPPSDMRPMDAAVKKFSKDLKVDTATLSDVIQISYLNPDRDVAIQVLSNLIQMYQEKHSALFAEQRSDFLGQQTKDYETRLNDITQKIGDLRQSQSLFDVSAQRTQLIQDRATLAGSLRALQTRAVDTHRHIDYLKEKLKSMTPLIVAGDTEAESVETAKGRLLDLQSQLQTLQQRYATDVKPILDVKEQIAHVQAFIDGKGQTNRRVWRMRDPAWDDGTVKLQIAEADAASFDEQINLQTYQLNELDAKLRSLEEGQSQLEALEREHQMLDELVHTYRPRFEEARINEELDKQKVVSVNVLQQPDASTKPFKPKRLMFVLIGFVLGSIGVSGVVVYLLVYRETLITAESVERILKLKVLTGVSLR